MHEPEKVTKRHIVGSIMLLLLYSVVLLVVIVHMTYVVGKLGGQRMAVRGGCRVLIYFCLLLLI